MANQPFFQNRFHTGVTVGTVVDVDDPQQTGRLRIYVPSYGDRPDAEIEDIPWAMYISPFGGISNASLKRGPGQVTSTGPIAYGFWNIPKLGASVAVTCIDGSPSSRLWIGCLHTERLNQTLPHGRFLINETGEPDGPLTSTEQPIEPLYQNLTTAFGPKKGNYEWRTRGADYATTATADNFYEFDNFCKTADDKGTTLTSEDGTSTQIRQGYALNQQSTKSPSYDSQVYSWTTPGFHSISMDDRKENCRVKIRTTGGHQIIMDDTNERIYINTSEGNNWIEIDQDGNIDVYSSVKVNIRSADINLTADKSIRMYAGEAIHMFTKDIRMETTQDIHVRAAQNIKTHSGKDTTTQTDTSYNLKIGTEGMVTTGGTLHLTAGGDILEQGTKIHLNGPTPKAAVVAGEEMAKFVNRIPGHEPWHRCGTKQDEGEERTLDSKFEYNDPNVGREDKERGDNWRR